MANIESAKKRAKQAKARRLRNVDRLSATRTAVKKVRKDIDKGDSKAARDAFPKMASVLDKAAQKGLIHKNKAARLKSRVNKQIKLLVLGAQA